MTYGTYHFDRRGHTIPGHNHIGRSRQVQYNVHYHYMGWQEVYILFYLQLRKNHFTYRASPNCCSKIKILHDFLSSAFLEKKNHFVKVNSQSVKQFRSRSHFVMPELGPNCLQNLILFFVLFWGFTSQSTAMVISRWSVHLTTFFPGQAWLSG